MSEASQAIARKQTTGSNEHSIGPGTERHGSLASNPESPTCGPDPEDRYSEPDSDDIYSESEYLATFQLHTANSAAKVKLENGADLWHWK